MKSKDEVTKEFVYRGDTIAAWAGRHGYKKRTVYAVLAGHLKASSGISHRIAVQLGLKEGVIVDPPLPVSGC